MRGVYDVIACERLAVLTMISPLILLLNLLPLISSQDVTFAEQKSGNTSVCDVITEGEGKFTYSGGDSASACCTAGGIADFKLKSKAAFMSKEKKSKLDPQPICCLTPGSVCSGSSMKCCNNDRCDNNKCKEIDNKSGFKVEITKEKENCLAAGKKYHLKVKVGDYVGDACCDTDKAHMIKYDDHCCSVSNTPFIVKKKELTPKCCGKQPEGVLQFSQYGNDHKFWVKKGTSGIAFCRDNLSGSWERSANLNAEKFYFGNPLYDYNKSTKAQEPQCCQNVKDRTFAFDEGSHTNDKACCITRTVRFREKDEQRKGCCTYTGRCKTDNIPCCEGKCTDVRKDGGRNEDPVNDYACVVDGGKRADRRTAKCK